MHTATAAATILLEDTAGIAGVGEPEVHYGIGRATSEQREPSKRNSI